LFRFNLYALNLSRKDNVNCTSVESDLVKYDKNYTITGFRQLLNDSLRLK